MIFHFGSNLKMNQGPEEARSFVRKIRAWLEAMPDRGASVQLWAALSYTNLAAADGERGGSGLWIGAQNVHWEDAGAFTGEISPVQLNACGATFALVGHAERRALFDETDERVAAKLRACARHGLRAILCVGESRDAYGAGTGGAFVDRQLELAFAGYEAPHLLIVLYEPVWSIGDGGRAADPGYVDGALARIRSFLTRRFGDAGTTIPILYGGSVDAENAADYTALMHCNGLGVGRAAWRAEDFLNVLQSCLRGPRQVAAASQPTPAGP